MHSAGYAWVSGGHGEWSLCRVGKADLATQEKYEVGHLRYWVDESAGKILCLVEADNADDANTVHREATASWPTRSSRSANTADSFSKEENQ